MTGAKLMCLKPEFDGTREANSKPYVLDSSFLDSSELSCPGLLDSSARIWARMKTFNSLLTPSYPPGEHLDQGKAERPNTNLSPRGRALP